MHASFAETDLLVRSQDLHRDSVGAHLINRPGSDGYTPLNHAAKSGNKDKVSILISMGANPDLHDLHDLHGVTPLVSAVSNDHKGVAQLLLDSRADPNLRDGFGRSPLSYALFFGHLGIAEILVANGARSTDQDVDNRSDLDYASHFIRGKNMLEAVKIARKAGASVKIASNTRLIPIRSDPDFVMLDVLQAESKVKMFCRSFIIMVVLFGSALLAHQSYMGLLSLVPIFLAGLMGPFVLGIRAFRMRRLATRLTSNDDQINQQSIAMAGSARSVSNLLLQLSSRIHTSKAKDTSIAADGVSSLRKIFTLLLCVPLAVFVICLGLFNLSILFLVFTVFLAGFCIWLRSLIIKRLVERLLFKQKKQSDQMSKFLDEITVSESLPDNANSDDLVLYLRGFEQDERITVGQYSFEAILAYSLSLTGDLVAIGSKESLLGPAQITAKNSSWQSTVRELATRAKVIVIVPATTEGVRWEIEMLRSEGFFEKTIFVAPPSDDADAGNAVSLMWRKLVSDNSFKDLEIPSYLSDGFIFCLDSAGQLKSWANIGLVVEPSPLDSAPKVLTTNSSYSHATIGHVAGNGVGSSHAHAVHSHMSSNSGSYAKSGSSMSGRI